MTSDRPQRSTGHVKFSSTSQYWITPAFHPRAITVRSSLHCESLFREIGYKIVLFGRKIKSTSSSPVPCSLGVRRRRPARTVYPEQSEAKKSGSIHHPEQKELPELRYARRSSGSSAVPRRPARSQSICESRIRCLP